MTCIRNIAPLTLIAFAMLTRWPVVRAAPEDEDKDKASDRRAKAHVYYCHDGDTCHVQVEGSMWMNVRFAGIDAPEVGSKRKKGHGQAYGEESREKVNALVKGKDVELRQVDLDPYNRPVVEVFLAGGNINLKLLEEGYAEMYRGKTKRLDKAQYEEAEAKAKKAKVGIWSLANYQSPALYRKEQK